MEAQLSDLFVLLFQESVLAAGAASVRGNRVCVLLGVFGGRAVIVSHVLLVSEAPFGP